MINVYIAKFLKGKTENLRNFEVSRISREYLRIKDKNAYVNPHTHKHYQIGKKYHSKCNEMMGLIRWKIALI